MRLSEYASTQRTYGSRKVPRSVQQSIPIDQIYEDGTWRCGNVYSQMWSMPDINFTMSDEDNKAKILNLLGKVYMGVPSDCWLKICIQMGKIQFQNVNKVYPNGFHAIHDFNLDVDDGEFIVFVGPSGCGKSTVLRMLAGLEEITSGKLLLDGKVINNRPPVERDIAIVFQDYALYGNLSVYDNVGISMKVQHQKDTAIYDKVQQAAATVDIQQYLNRLPGQLSGGQKQRVALARSIIRHPKAFLMDEPLSNLDAKLRNSTRIEIVKLQRSLKVTTIYVTHDQTEAMTMADRMVVMKEGVVQQVGTPREIYGLPVNMFVAGFIGSPQINFIRGKLEGETFVCGENRLRLAPWAAHKLEAWSSKEVILGLHPEVFSLAEEAGDGTFKADFVAKEFMGSHLIIHAQIQQQDVQCRIDDTSACFGGRLYLKPDMSRAHFFDAETGEAILHMEAGDDHA